MKILSWNVRGLDSSEQRAVVKQVIRNQKAAVVIIQESKINSGEERKVKDIWGSKHINWATLKEAGASGHFCHGIPVRLALKTNGWESSLSPLSLKTWKIIKNV